MLTWTQIDNRRKWIAELRSGKWEQLRGPATHGECGRCLFAVAFQAVLGAAGFAASSETADWYGMPTMEQWHMMQRNDYGTTTFAQFADELEQSVVLAEAELAAAEPAAAAVPAREAVLA